MSAPKQSDPARSPAAGLGLVGKALDEAELAPAVEDESDYGGGGPPPGRPVLEDGVPVVPLGLVGDNYFYLDQLGQFRELKAKEHSKLNLQALLGVHADRVEEWWPRYNKDGDTTGWHAERFADQLMRAAAGRGVFDSLQRLRGRGAWRGADGRLVMHCGDQVLVGAGAEGGVAEVLPPGPIGRHVYPTYSPLPRPYGAAVMGGEKGPAGQLLRLLQSWNWRRPEVDPYLLLGWICAALIGGALDWRPLVWLTGDRGTGKSTLQELVGDLIGEDAMVKTAETSAAGIWQDLGPATLPVTIDEIEAEDDDRRAQAVIKLARVAASGGLILRGGADHSASKFVARSCFLFSSILVPPLRPQDLSRIAVLDLRPIESATALRWRAVEMAELGAKLRRRMLDGWARFPTILEAYRQALHARGHDGRGCDLFGTLLACAEVALHDRPPDGDSLDGWAEQLATSAAERDSDSDHWHCLMHLMSSTIDPFRSGAKRTVASWCMQAAQVKADDVPVGESGEISDSMRLDALKALAGNGLKLVDRPEGRVLLVANTHQSLSAIYEDTHWKARSGASGVWRQALGRLPGALEESSPQRFGGVQTRCVSVPFSVIQGKTTPGD